jgi:hypothetical protein
LIDCISPKLEPLTGAGLAERPAVGPIFSPFGVSLDPRRSPFNDGDSPRSEAPLVSRCGDDGRLLDDAWGDVNGGTSRWVLVNPPVDRLSGDGALP